jgi:hypothetical protein
VSIDGTQFLEPATINHGYSEEALCLAETSLAEIGLYKRHPRTSNLQQNKCEMKTNFKTISFPRAANIHRITYIKEGFVGMKIIRLRSRYHKLSSSFVSFQYFRIEESLLWRNRRDFFAGYVFVYRSRNKRTYTVNK